MWNRVIPALWLRAEQAPAYHGFLTLLSSGTTPLLMKTVSIVVDEQLLEQIDAVAHSRRRKRSDLFCEAARQWLKQQQLKARIRQDYRGYRRHPVEPDEFGPLLRAQQWEES